MDLVLFFVKLLFFVDFCKRVISLQIIRQFTLVCEHEWIVVSILSADHQAVQVGSESHMCSVMFVLVFVWMDVGLEMFKRRKAKKIYQDSGKNVSSQVKSSQERTGKATPLNGKLYCVYLDYLENGKLYCVYLEW
jgi:hypothetical protein